MAKKKRKVKKQDKLLQEMQATEKPDFNLKLKDLVLPIGVLLLIGIIKVSCEAIPSMLVNVDQFHCTCQPISYIFAGTLLV